MSRSSCATFVVVSISWNTPRYAVCRLVRPFSRSSRSTIARPRADRLERLDPAGEVALPRRRLLVQPVVVGGQVELAHAAGNRRALLDRHQPFVFAQVRADLAGLREQVAR